MAGGIDQLGRAMSILHRGGIVLFAHVGVHVADPTDCVTLEEKGIEQVLRRKRKELPWMEE
jgi:hypothetical protein